MKILYQCNGVPEEVLKRHKLELDTLPLRSTLPACTEKGQVRSSRKAISHYEDNRSTRSEHRVAHRMGLGTHHARHAQYDPAPHHREA